MLLFLIFLIRIQTLESACRWYPPCYQTLFSSACALHVLQCTDICIADTSMESRIEHHCQHFQEDPVLASHRQHLLSLLRCFFHLLDAVCTLDSAKRRKIMQNHYWILWYYQILPALKLQSGPALLLLYDLYLLWKTILHDWLVQYELFSTQHRASHSICQSRLLAELVALLLLWMQERLLLP